MNRYAAIVLSGRRKQLLEFCWAGEMSASVHEKEVTGEAMQSIGPRANATAIKGKTPRQADTAARIRRINAEITIARKPRTRTVRERVEENRITDGICTIVDV